MAKSLPLLWPKRLKTIPLGAAYTNIAYINGCWKRHKCPALLSSPSDSISRDLIKVCMYVLAHLKRKHDSLQAVIRHIVQKLKSEHWVSGWSVTSFYCVDPGKLASKNKFRQILRDSWWKLRFVDGKRVRIPQTSDSDDPQGSELAAFGAGCFQMVALLGGSSLWGSKKPLQKVGSTPGGYSHIWAI